MMVTFSSVDRLISMRKKRHDAHPVELLYGQKFMLERRDNVVGSKPNYVVALYTVRQCEWSLVKRVVTEKNPFRRTDTVVAAELWAAAQLEK